MNVSNIWASLLSHAITITLLWRTYICQIAYYFLGVSFGATWTSPSFYLDRNMREDVISLKIWIFKSYTFSLIIHVSCNNLVSGGENAQLQIKGASYNIETWSPPPALFRLVLILITRVAIIINVNVNINILKQRPTWGIIDYTNLPPLTTQHALHL